MGFGQTGGRAIDRGPAAVHQKCGASDVARGVRRQESDRGGHFVRPCPSIEYGMRSERIPDFRPCFKWLDQRRLDDARHHGVDSHAEGADFGGKPTHHLDNAGLGGTVDGEPRLERGGAD
jgi:hypothetical protein